MKIPNVTKGYLFAFTAAIALANVYIFSKAALNQVSLPQFGFYWFGFAIFWNFLYSTVSGHFKTINRLSGFQIRNLLGIGLMEVIATTSIFLAINTIANPTIPAFVRNLEPICIVVLGVFVLNEKLNRIELIGVILTIFGTLIVSYNKNGSLEHLFINGVQYLFISSIFYAIRTIWSKTVIHKITPLTLNLNKVVALFLTSCISLIFAHQSLVIPSEAILNILIGSLLGPFYTSFAQFSSLKYIDASRTALIQGTTGFFTLILAYFFFDTLPFAYQVSGGIITLTGLAFLTLKKKSLRFSLILVKNN